MAGTFSQIYIQYVFAVKGRENLLQKPWRDEVFKYIAGIIKEKNQNEIFEKVFKYFDDNNISIENLLIELKEELKSIDINTLTPVEALMKLNEIKRKIG